VEAAQVGVGAAAAGEFVEVVAGVLPIAFVPRSTSAELGSWDRSAAADASPVTGWT
jgi:hypothetical protein